MRLSLLLLLSLGGGCSRPTEPQDALFPGLSPQPGVSALALGLSAPDFGLTTVWLELSDATVRRSAVYDGLHLLTPHGPRHRQEIAARAEQSCEAGWRDTCGLLIAEVVDGVDAETAREALQVRAEAEVRCFHEHSLSRVQSASPERLTLALASGSAPCAEVGGGYDERAYATEGWQEDAPPPTLAPAHHDALQAELLAGWPALADALQETPGALVQERAAGVKRTRAAGFVQAEDGEPVEVSVVVGEVVEPVDFVQVLARWPDATDVLVSPDQSVIVVRRGVQRLVAVRVADGTPIGEAIAPGRIVMAEWITGEADVGRWAAAMALDAEAR